ncbi:HAMP domain-containing histidine kinase [Candidatus Shapirobacteria bacterium]|nr:HAMP domain-containing histidine kinase [Candidatus Shapirobacteria bacterium]
MKLKHKAWLLIGGYTAGVLLIAFGILGGTYYWYSLNLIKKELMFAKTELVTDQIITNGKEMLFQKDNLGRTVAAFLRDENLSAVFWDREGKLFAAYGVYARLNSEGRLGVSQKQGDQEGLMIQSFYPGEDYYTMTSKVIKNGVDLGIVQLATSELLFQNMLNKGIYLLLGILLVSLLISWPMTNRLLDYIFDPIEKLTLAMKTAKAEKNNQKLEYSGDDSDEIGVVVQAYNQMISRIEDTYEKQKTFVSNASHELKTPLARAISMVDVALIKLKDKKYKATEAEMEKVNQEMIGFAKLIDKLLLLSKVEDGGQIISKKRIRVDALIEKVIAEQKVKTKNKIEIQKIGVGGMVMADKLILEIILANLLLNAIKYSNKNGKVKVMVGSRNTEVSITIRDFGVGIKAEEINKIWERFYRSDKQLGVAGTGVGLAIVRQLAGLHGLKVVFKEVKVGSKVVVQGLERVGS